MSNRKELSEISSSDAKKLGVVALATRPNDVSRYGQGGLSAEALKEWFDKLPKFIKDKFNEIARMLASSDAAKYITVAACDVDNLHDFLALFSERGTGMNDKNISDYIQTLYTPKDESNEKSMALKAIVEDIVSRIVSIKVEHETAQRNIEYLYDILQSALISIDPGNVIRFNFDAGEFYVSTEAKIDPVNTDGITDGAVTTSKIADGAVTEDKIKNEAVVESKLSPELQQSINSAFHQVEYDPKTGTLKFSCPGGSMSIDLPLEMVVNNGYFDDANNDLVLVLNNGNKISIPLDALSEKITSDIAELKERLDTSFMDVRLSDDQKLIFTWQDQSEKEIDLSDFAYDDKARTAISDLTDRVNTLEGAQGDLSTILDQLNKGGIE